MLKKKKKKIHISHQYSKPQNFLLFTFFKKKNYNSIVTNKQEREYLNFNSPTKALNYKTLNKFQHYFSVFSKFIIYE